MISNSTQSQHGTRSPGHAHGIRSSIASVLRRKGSALVSLSALVRGTRLNHHHQHQTNSQTWTTDPTEDRPSFYHLENACSSPYGSWSSGRNQTPHHRKRQFWTVSGTRYRARSSSTENEYTPRMSRARSFVLSLRKRGSIFHEDYTFEEEEGTSDEDSSEEAAPILDMPSGCASDTEPASSFWLGVQKALRDTVDEDFSLHRGSEQSSTDHGLDSESIVTHAPRMSPAESHLELQAHPFFNLPIWEPRESSTDVPSSLSWVCDTRGHLSDGEVESSQLQPAIRTLIGAYQNLTAELQIRKNSKSDSPQQLDACDGRLGQLRELIDSLARTLSPGAHVNVNQEAEDQENPAENGEPPSSGTQTAGSPEYEASRCDQNCITGSSDGDSGSRQSSDFEDVDRSASDCTSIGSEAIPGPPNSTPTGIESPTEIEDEGIWQMRCTQSLLEAHMRQQHPQVNPDA